VELSREFEKEYENYRIRATLTAKLEPSSFILKLIIYYRKLAGDFISEEYMKKVELVYDEVDLTISSKTVETYPRTRQLSEMSLTIRDYNIEDPETFIKPIVESNDLDTLVKSLESLISEVIENVLEEVTFEPI
jgi:hypothetical protein